MAVTVERLVADIEANPTQAVAALEAFSLSVDAAARDRTAHIDVDVDRNSFSTVTSGLDGIANSAGGAGDGIDRVSGAAGRGRGPLRMFAMALGALTIAGAVGAALSILPGIIGAIGAAAGAGIPMLGAFGAGLLTMIVGVSGISKAYQAQTSVNKQAEQSTFDLARRTRELDAALRGLREAQHGVIRAQRELKDAQEAMRNAPREAAEAITDAHLAAQQAVLGERAAVLALKDAQKALTDAQSRTLNGMQKVSQETDYFTGKVYDVADASNAAVDAQADMERLQLNLAQAELGVAEAKRRNTEAQQELDEKQKDGIKGSEVYIDAAERLKDAQYGLASAHDNVAAAEDRIAEARERLKNGGADATAASRALKDAMDDLSPAGVTFVEFLQKKFVPALKRVRKQAQQGLLPGVQRGLERLLPFEDRIADGFFRMGEAIGLATDKFFKFWTSQRQVEQTSRIWDEFIRIIPIAGDLFTNLTAIFGDLAEAAAPLARWILTGISDWLEKKHNTTNIQELRDWFNSWKPELEAFGRLVRGIFGIFFNENRKGSPNSAFSETADILSTRLVPTLERLFTALEDSDLAQTFALFLTDVLNIITRIVESGYFTGLWKAIRRVTQALSWFLDNTPDAILAPALWASTIGLIVGKLIGKGSFLAGLTKIKNFIGSKKVGLVAAVFVLINALEDLKNVFTTGKLKKGQGLYGMIDGTFKKLQEWADQLGWESVAKFLGEGIERGQTLAEDDKGNKRALGGPVKKGESYIVGERRPELFVPSTSGRIMPTVPSHYGGSSGGVSEAQLERILNAALDRARPDVSVEQTFNEKVDPAHMSAELIWKVAS